MVMKVYIVAAPMSDWIGIKLSREILILSCIQRSASHYNSTVCPKRPKQMSLYRQKLLISQLCIATNTQIYV